MDISHRASDQQSLLLTQAGIDAMRERPALVDAVIATLDHWDQVAPVASRPLRDE